MKTGYASDQKVNSEQPNDLPEKLSNPAKRALAAAGISRLEQLSHFREAEIKKLHGIGPNALILLEHALDKKGLTFNIEK